MIITDIWFASLSLFFIIVTVLIISNSQGNSDQQSDSSFAYSRHNFDSKQVDPKRMIEYSQITPQRNSNTIISQSQAKEQKIVDIILLIQTNIQPNNHHSYDMMLSKVFHYFPNIPVYKLHGHKREQQWWARIINHAQALNYTREFFPDKNVLIIEDENVFNVNENVLHEKLNYITQSRVTWNVIPLSQYVKEWRKINVKINIKTDMKKNTSRQLQLMHIQHSTSPSAYVVHKDSVSKMANFWVDYINTNSMNLEILDESCIERCLQKLQDMFFWVGWIDSIVFENGNNSNIPINSWTASWDLKFWIDMYGAKQTLILNKDLKYMT